MRITVFSTQPYDRQHLDVANGAHGHELVYLETRLAPETAAALRASAAVCAFVNDDLGRGTLTALASHGTRLVALRCTGFNNVDLAAARDLGITIARVPAYSPHAVAEHAVALILSLNRKIHRAYARVREGNFTLNGLVGFDLAGRTVGVIGMGAIGQVFSQIMSGFGCTLLGHDPAPDAGRPGVAMVPLRELLNRADIISLHCPLTPETHHLIDRAALDAMKPGAMLINTSRGAVVDTRALIAALKAGKLHSVGLDVYEEESNLFFEDLSSRVIGDDVFARLLTFPNVLITAHQGFLTAEALSHIAETTLRNVTAFASNGTPLHPVSVERLAS
jgi:D-lactate dehydrogenase